MSNATINIPKYIKAVRPADPEGLTPADLQPYLLFLMQEAANLQPLLLELKGGTWSSDKLHTIGQLQRDLDLYRERLSVYLDYINEAVAEDPGSSRLAQPVVRPLFRGKYPDDHRLPGGNADTLCSGSDVCYDSTPDVATIAILRNGLAEFGEFERYQQEQFLRDVETRTKELWSGLMEVLTPNLFRIPDLLPDLPTNDPTKWIAYGAVGALGLLAVYKLMK